MFINQLAQRMLHKTILYIQLLTAFIDYEIKKYYIQLMLFFGGILVICRYII